MPIYNNIPNQFYRCNDNTLSDHNRRGACNYHSGLSGEIITTGTDGTVQNIFDVPLSEIHTNEKWFQNRADLYSTRSVSNIIDAVQNNTFKWVNFDPITLYLAKDGKYYILSGHSRTEAFVQLSAMRLQADGIGFDYIPAKIIDNISLAEAQQIARESNTLSTKETDLERAVFYARMRSEGANNKEINQTAKRLEGSNWSKIIPYSYLNQNGSTWSALSALENNTDSSNSIISNVAKWIGNARKSYPLTNSHEEELYKWLIIDKAYGTGSGKIKNGREFDKRLSSIIQRKTNFGILDERLNIENNITKSPTEATYDLQIEEAKNEVLKLEKELKQKTNELAQRGATETEITNITAGLEATLRRKRIAYQNLLQSKGRIMAHAANEVNLFDSVNGVNTSGADKANSFAIVGIVGIGVLIWHLSK